MKKIILLATLGMLATPSFADNAYGVWKSEKFKDGSYGHIKIGACGDKVCGTLVKWFGPNGKEAASERMGKYVVWDMVPDGSGNYKNGKIWAPDNGKTYKSKMKLTGAGLGVKGCIGPICRDGGTWQRVK